MLATYDGVEWMLNFGFFDHEMACFGGFLRKSEEEQNGYF